MIQRKDYSLLRPFDPEAAKRGEPVCLPDGAPVAYVAGPNRLNTVVCQWGDEQFSLANRGQLRMAPLCWVEGRPVYKGDRLWDKNTATPCEYVVLWVDKDGILQSDGTTNGWYAEAENLTWTQPKVKCEGWIVADIEAARNMTSEQAYKIIEIAPNRLQAIRIEWEESAPQKGEVK